MRVVGRDGSRTPLAQARISSDSIVGHTGRGDSRHRVSMAIADVVRVESLEPDATRTLLLIATPFLLLIAGALSY